MEDNKIRTEDYLSGDHGEFGSVAEKILALSDRLSENIILENISQQFEEKNDIFADKFNYVALYKNKYKNILPEDPEYDKEYMFESLERVTSLVANGLETKFGVKLGREIDEYALDEYLLDMEAIYEFFYVRQFSNLVDFFDLKLAENRNEYLDAYSPLMSSEEHSKDVFVQRAKRKFKFFDDVIILHFLREILNDIRSEEESASELFKDIINADPFEECNARMDDLVSNYGAGISFVGDRETYSRYMMILDEPGIMDELENKIREKYSETIELIED